MIGHRSNYYAEIVENEKGIPRLLIKSYWKNEVENVAYNDIDSEDFYERNLYLTVGGYLTIFKDNQRMYEEKEIFNKICMNSFSLGNLTFDSFYLERSCRNLIKYNENIKYFLKAFEKINFCIYPLLFWRLLKNWLQNYKIEFLLKNNLFYLASDKRFLNFTPKKQKEVVNFISKNVVEIRSRNSINLTVILKALKNNCSLTDAQAICDFKINNLKDLHYLKSQANDYYNSSRNIRLWEDYLKMCKDLAINIEDSYWRYPKNLVEAHANILNEINKRKEIEEAELNQKRFETFELLNSEKRYDNYIISFPKNMEDIKKQADALNQCLIRCAYDKKHADRKSALVFIKDLKNNPVGTAEIHKSNEIVQFYLNEEDRKNMLPNEELKEIMNDFINEYKWFEIIKKHERKKNNGIHN